MLGHELCQGWEQQRPKHLLEWPEIFSNISAHALDVLPLPLERVASFQVSCVGELACHMGSNTDNPVVNLWLEPLALAFLRAKVATNVTVPLFDLEWHLCKTSEYCFLVQGQGDEEDALLWLGEVAELLPEHFQGSCHCWSTTNGPCAATLLVYLGYTSCENSARSCSDSRSIPTPYSIMLRGLP